MKNILLIFLVSTSTFATAQKFSITGQLVDSLGQPLPSATVLLLSAKDSSLVNFTVADFNGNFALRNISNASQLLKVTFMGYRTFVKSIPSRDAVADISLGKIEMEPVANELDEIVIAADRAPVTVKKDTIEFNARSFKTRENAMVEDLLKKLPGVEVDNDGNITAQGEEVKNVTVDGKKFFGSDPKLATRNLPADAVDKVQVFDKASDQAVFTGIDDGERQKTINLELKEEKRNAMFGNIVAGAGTDERLQASLSLNKFTKGRQLSFLGMGNNINHSGFGMEEYMNFTGGAREMRGGGRMQIQLNSDNTKGVPLDFGNRVAGIMNTGAGGVNLNNEFNKKTEINGSYFYNYLHHDRDETIVRENFLDNGNFIFQQDSRQTNTNSNHRANVTVDHKVDSANTIRFTSNFTLNETDSDQQSNSENILPDRTLASGNYRQYLSGRTNTSANATLLYRHRFEKKGRSVSANAQFRATTSKTEGMLEAVNTYYGETAVEENLRQNNEHATDYLSYGATVSYTEPVGKRKYLEANYNFRQNTNDVIRRVFNINNGEATPDALLSSRYNSHYEYHRAGLNFRITGSDYNLVTGTSYQKTYLTGESQLPDSETIRSFTNMLPSLRFNYDFSDSKHLRFDYETSVREPDIRELQPIVDNSDPLNINVGNPELRPSYSQSWRLNFTSFNPINFISFFAFTDIDYTSNAIVEALHIDEHFVRTISPVNVNNSFSINNQVNLGIPLKQIGSRFHLGGNFRRENSIAPLNGRENEITRQAVGTNLQYNYQYKETLDLTLSTRIDRRKASYESDQPDQVFVNRIYGLKASVSFFKSYSFNADFQYLKYENKTVDFSQQIPFLDLSVSRFLLRNRAGELKIGANNLLDKALNINQSADVNYTERVTTNSLGRYFMVSFTYALNKRFNPMAMRGRGPMMRIIRQR